MTSGEPSNFEIETNFNDEEELDLKQKRYFSQEIKDNRDLWILFALVILFSAYILFFYENNAEIEDNSQKVTFNNNNPIIYETNKTISKTTQITNIDNSNINLTAIKKNNSYIQEDERLIKNMKANLLLLNDPQYNETIKSSFCYEFFWEQIQVVSKTCPECSYNWEYSLSEKSCRLGIVKSPTSQLLYLIRRIDLPLETNQDYYFNWFDELNETINKAKG